MVAVKAPIRMVEGERPARFGGRAFKDCRLVDHLNDTSRIQLDLERVVLVSTNKVRS